MKVKSFLLSILFLFPVVATAVVADEEPRQNPTETLVRKAGYDTLETILSKNFYRTEYREEWHTHAHHGDHHPGHDPSTWYETYEEQERYCHPVEYWDQEPYYVTEPYWTWEYYWHTERYQERVCDNHGCRMVWRTRRVQKRRWVQKYRQVLRYRPVKKVRCDYRYRTVVKRRLRTFNDSHAHQVPFEVFDHQNKLNVTLVFPELAELREHETESIRLAYDGTNVSVDITSSHYIYRELRRLIDDDTLVITLELGVLDSDEYGRSSIEGLQLVGEGEQTRLKFVDKKPFYRVGTTYHLLILDEMGEKVVDGGIPLSEGQAPLRTFDLPLVPGRGTLGDHVYKILKGFIDYRLILTVMRESVLLPGSRLSFRLESKRKGVLDNNLFSRHTVPDFRLVKRNGAIYLRIVDNAAGHERVNTTYSLKLDRNTFLFGKTVVARANWQSDGSKEMMFLLSRGADNPVARGLREKMDDDETYRMRLRVHRQSELFTGGQVSFEILDKMEPRH